MGREKESERRRGKEMERERERAKERERDGERGGESDIVIKREGEKIFFFQSQARLCSYKIVQIHLLKC